MGNQCYSGGCLCGHIRYEVNRPPGNPHCCSCTFCQRHSGAPTLCWVEFTCSSVRWTGVGGMPTLYRSSDYSSRAFCPRCGSTLGAVDDQPTVALAVGSFDDATLPELQPSSHSFVDACPGWWKVEGMR